MAPPSNTLCVAALMLAGALSVPAGATPSPEPAVQARLEREARDFMLDWERQDIASIAARLAPGFLFAGPQGFRTRTETLEALGHCKVAGFSLDSFRMRTISAGSAILAYRIHRDMVCGGHRVLGETLNTDAFVKIGRAWEILFTSEIASPTPHGGG
nr:nuclear transport factor 2 family protein [uncultured Lichenicoccus sp.]